MLKALLLLLLMALFTNALLRAPIVCTVGDW